jgi:hypothetical protein
MDYLQTALKRIQYNRTNLYSEDDVFLCPFCLIIPKDSLGLDLEECSEIVKKPDKVGI